MHNIKWSVNPEGMQKVLEVCDEIYHVEPGPDGTENQSLVFNRLDVMANGISDDGELPLEISKEDAILLARLVIDPEFS